MPATQQGAVTTGEHRLDRIKSAVESHEQLRAEVANKANGGDRRPNTARRVFVLVKPTWRAWALSKINLS